MRQAKAAEGIMQALDSRKFRLAPETVGPGVFGPSRRALMVAEDLRLSK